MNKQVKNLLDYISRCGWPVYEAVVIASGAANAVFLTSRFLDQVGKEEADALLFSGILLLYIVFDLFRIPYKELAISLGFPAVLFALLGSQISGPLIVAEIVTLGSLCSESLYRLFVRHDLLSKFDRVLFYAAHHTLAALAAMTAFETVQGELNAADRLGVTGSETFIDLNYIFALVLYLVVYSLVSSVLMTPHDWAIQTLRLPEDEVRMSRVHLVGSVALMTPVPIALSVFLFALAGTSRLVLSLVFPALFLAFLIIARSYARIERETIDRRSRDAIRRRLLNLTRFDEEMLQSVSVLVEQLLRNPGRLWIAIYARLTNNCTMWLRGEKRLNGQVRIYQVGNKSVKASVTQSDASSNARSSLHEIRWPRWVEPGQEMLGQVVQSQLARSGLTAQIDFQEAVSNPLMPSDTAYLYIPLQHEGGVVGLLTLARPRHRFTKRDLDSLMPMATVLSQRIISIQRFEQQIEALYGRVEDYVADPMAVRQAIESLIARGITQLQMNDILALIPERAFQKHFDETLQAFAESRARDRFSLLDDEDLALVYAEVQRREQGRMPPSDDSVLRELRTIACSLSVAFSFHHHLSERDRSESYIPLYRACRSALMAETIPGITHQRGGFQDALRELEKAEDVSSEITSALGWLDVAISHLEQSEQADTTDLRRQQLENALASLVTVEQTIKESEGPVRLIFANWLASWRKVILGVLAAESAEETRLEITLRSDRALPLQHVDVALSVKNVGRGTVTRVVAELLPQNAYKIVSEPKVNLGTLQPQKTKDAEFVLEPHETQYLPLVFRVSYWHSRDTWRRTQVFESRLLLTGKWPEYAERIDSPYVVGRPLEPGDSLFFGRDDIFEFIRQNVTLGGQREPQVLVLIGERRVGKTSIAKQLPERLQDEGYIHVYFDAQTLMDERQFLLTLATCIAEKLRDAGIAMDDPPLTGFLDHPGYTFQYSFLPQMSKQLGERRLLVAIDEYEALERRVRSGKEDQDLFEYLRSLIQHGRKMVFIFLGVQEMQELAADYWHVLFNVAKYRTIGSLSEGDAQRLITEPVRPKSDGECSGIVYDELAVKEILQSTGRHPYLLQMVCDQLVEVCNVDQVSYVTLDRVRKALQGVIEMGKSHLEWLWNSTLVQERVVLASLAECLWEGALGTAEGIVQRAQQAGQALDVGAAHRALGRLERRQIVGKLSGETNTYQFTASLYGMWIHRAHPLVQQTDADPMWEDEFIVG